MWAKVPLVQSVYNEESIQNSFDLTTWVCVSNKFELKRLIMEIIESASITRPCDFHNLQNLDSAQRILKGGSGGEMVSSCP